jgi:hypothetical protein
MQTSRKSLTGFLADENQYQEWRRSRLNSRPLCAQDITVDIDGLLAPAPGQVRAIMTKINSCNMAIYRCRDLSADRIAVKRFAASFGLGRLDHHLCANRDGVSELTVENRGQKAFYVPYSNRSLSWHTDGYYNEKSRQVNAVVLHCVQDAESGGENAVLDHELVYIMLRDADSRYVQALEHPQCMTIPANETAEGEIRPSVSGPVFSYDVDNSIHMRYSARKRNIQWRDDGVTQEALQLLTEILDNEQGPAIRYRLKPGEGLISNNVLHNRTAFSDTGADHRLLYRARFFDRIKTS